MKDCRNSDFILVWCSISSFLCIFLGLALTYFSLLYITTNMELYRESPAGVRLIYIRVVLQYLQKRYVAAKS